MTLPQFPNFFYGSVTYHGEPAPIGLIVTAVCDQREFILGVGPKGKFGTPNGRKLKVGISGEPIPNGARIAFYVSEGPLKDLNLLEAGHSHFYADSDPHITRLTLCQD